MLYWFLEAVTLWLWLKANWLEILLRNKLSKAFNGSTTAGRLLCLTKDLLESLRLRDSFSNQP